MKILIFISLAVFFVYTNGVFVPPRHPHKQQGHELLGAKECTWGPSYWCTNLTTAAGCHAVKHCIQTDWIHRQLPPDTTSVCQTCLDMVKQARDQLLSNETQELIKEVFEGSCHLLRIKPIVKECDKIADDYIPELIDTLASQMNPQVVCSVAGLCNSERVLRMLQEAGGDIQIQSKPTVESNTCEGCHTVVGLMETKLREASRDDVLQGFLMMCGKLGSFSDACSNIIVTYFTEIYKYIQDNFNSNDVCLMAGECSAQFHTHANVEITPISHIGYVQVAKPTDDPLPCQLCEQLVKHLRDLLIANTTEAEFKLVLEGLCKQTRSFEKECLGLVDQYYALAYEFLMTELNSTEVCGIIGICSHGKKTFLIAPLLPVETAPKAIELSAPEKPLVHVGLTKDKSSVKILSSPQQAQLPIELLVPPHTQNLYNKETCVFCEYFLHYVQEAITDPKTEDKIKKVINEGCDHLPSAVHAQCLDFVNVYEPALIAILAQEIDPSRICPLIRACPSVDDAGQVEVFMHQQDSESKCPLCLFIVSDLESLIKDKKTEENIRKVLSGFCSKLSHDLAAECNDFVTTYTDELVEMMIADFKPAEVCQYLNFCSATTKKPIVHSLIGDVDTNMIPDNTFNGVDLMPNTQIVHSGPQCVLCEFVMKEVEDQLKNKRNEEEIKKIVHGICNAMPKSISTECNDFVNQYADTIIQLLIQAIEPSEICSVIHLCQQKLDDIDAEVLNCAICEVAVEAIEKILSNPKVDHRIDHVLEKACRAFPREYRTKCVRIVSEYGEILINLVTHYPDKAAICKKLEMCTSTPHRPVGFY